MPARLRTTRAPLTDDLISRKVAKVSGGSPEAIEYAATVGMWNLTDGHRAYLPTPEEIAAACAEIRLGWSEAEHRYRAAAMPQDLKASQRPRVSYRRGWLPPGVAKGGGQ